MNEPIITAKQFCVVLLLLGLGAAGVIFDLGLTKEARIRRLIAKVESSKQMLEDERAQHKEEIDLKNFRLLNFRRRYDPEWAAYEAQQFRLSGNKDLPVSVRSKAITDMIEHAEHDEPKISELPKVRERVVKSDDYDWFRSYIRLGIAIREHAVETEKAGVIRDCDKVLYDLAEEIDKEYPVEQ